MVTVKDINRDQVAHDTSLRKTKIVRELLLEILRSSIARVLRENDVAQKERKECVKELWRKDSLSVWLLFKDVYGTKQGKNIKELVSIYI